MQDDSSLSEKDRTIILKHFREQYEACCELCGKDSEEAAEAKQQYKTVLGNPVSKCRDIIIGYYRELNDAVDGRFSEIYSADPSLIEMIKRFI